jgi:hypothetical protein
MFEIPKLIVNSSDLFDIHYQYASITVRERKIEERAARGMLFKQG